MLQNQEKFSFEDFSGALLSRPSAIVCHDAGGSERAYLTARIYRRHPMPMVVVAADTTGADRFFEDLKFFFGAHRPPLLYFPPYNIQPFRFLAYHNETAARRIRCLYELIAGDPAPILVTTVAALLQRLIPRRELSDFAELVSCDEALDRDALVGKLVSGGYTRAIIVEEPGDFSVRGGILDVFTPTYPDPLRIEFYGDSVDSIRFFSASSQRTLTSVAEAVLLPAREAILKPGRLVEIVNRVRQQAALVDLPVTQVRTLVEQIKAEGTFPGAESLLPLIYTGLDSLFDYIAPRAVPVLIEPARLESAAEEAEGIVRKNSTEARSGGRLHVDPGLVYLPWREAEGRLQERRPVVFKSLAVTGTPPPGPAAPREIFLGAGDNLDLSVAVRHARDQQAPLTPLCNWLTEKARAGFVTLLVCRTATQAGRMESLLGPYGIRAQVASPPSLEESSAGEGGGGVRICCGHLSSGFIWPAESLAIVTEDEIFGAKHRSRKKDGARAAADPIAFGDLKQGDLVVHAEHGIGRYDELVKLKLDGAVGDFILISYRDGDKLYLPVDRLGMVQKYLGVEGVDPVLDKMGGASWEKVKSRVKRSAEKIAGELLKLYALRRVRDGYAFEAQCDYYRDFEAGFEYEETDDQLAAITDVLKDMETSTPMDRLVCGDVGYGKTEVALRAAFVAVSNGRQVAVLVPTTVLAEQHYETFSRRLEPYPFRVACLSRFRPPREQREIVKDLAAGKIDVVIGTHRLLQKDIAFKNLGLVVLDEEQRFGVKHKEKLKKFRQTVDVLTLTATPIPRTLHLSLTGIRDISVMSTPPEHRRPIITYVSEFDDAIVSEAIRKELARKGQVFFVHNHISSIHAMAGRIAALVPEARIEVAHGRMEEESLEGVMLAFVRREKDVLVCTSIIESGLDIPSANTIIINRADRFGLAQIYQLRGRVGRADEQAYAYLFIPRESALSADAGKRLKVLMEHSDLGAGFQIAMSDLKIRGGGTILGASQSGHIAAVGYDMFLKLMQEAVAGLKGEPVKAELEPEINLNLSAYLPPDYIADIDQRLLAYRRLAKMTELKELGDFRKELADRFGEPPEDANGLLIKIMLRVMSIQAGVKRLDVREGQLYLYFSPEHQKTPHGLVDLVTAAGSRFHLTPEHVLRAPLGGREGKGAVAEIKNILKEISRHVN